MTVACISVKLWSYQQHESCSMTHAPYSIHRVSASTSQKFIFEISTPMSHTFFELGEFWWISKNGENGFESDDLWFQQLRLSCHFLTNWFELFWFIMLKDTRHPTYTSCDMIHVQSETSFFCLCNQHQPPDQRKFRVHEKIPFFNRK